MKKNTEMSILSPKREALEILGNLSYSESTQSWNTLRLKQSVLQEFPQLKEKRGNFGYKMVLNTSFKEMKKQISQLEKESGVIPICLFLCRKK